MFHEALVVMSALVACFTMGWSLNKVHCNSELLLTNVLFIATAKPQ